MFFLFICSPSAFPEQFKHSEGICCFFKGPPTPRFELPRPAIVTTSCSLTSLFPGDLGDKGLCRCTLWLCQSRRPSPARSTVGQESPEGVLASCSRYPRGTGISLCSFSLESGLAAGNSGWGLDEAGCCWAGMW